MQSFKLSDSSMTINAHPLLMPDDTSACAKLAGQSDHFHLRGCRCCIIKAARIENKNAFPPYRKFIFRSKYSFRVANEGIGQKLPTPFTDLKLFHSAFFFLVGLDALIW